MLKLVFATIPSELKAKTNLWYVFKKHTVQLFHDKRFTDKNDFIPADIEADSSTHENEVTFLIKVIYFMGEGWIPPNLCVYVIEK